MLRYKKYNTKTLLLIGVIIGSRFKKKKEKYMLLLYKTRMCTLIIYDDAINVIKTLNVVQQRIFEKRSHVLYGKI